MSVACKNVSDSIDGTDEFGIDSGGGGGEPFIVEMEKVGAR